MQAVDAHYGSFARKDATLRVAFEQGEISLDIPKEGRLTNEGWRILPRSYPSVSHMNICHHGSSADRSVGLVYKLAAYYTY